MCGCAIVSVPAAAGGINGVLPTIDVAGAGTPTSPWNLTLNDEWAAALVDLFANIKAAYVATAQATSSTGYTDLATVGPSVSCTTGTSALVLLSALNNNSTTGNTNYLGVDVSGASTIAASDAKAVWDYDPSNANSNTMSGAVLVTGLTPGVNVFTVKYKTNSATATFTDRTIAVIPLL